MVSGFTLHVTGVSHATVTRLGCSLVEAHLQVQFSFVGAQLLFGESAFVLVCHFWAESWSSEFWVLLGKTSQRVEAQSDLSDVATFKQVSGLKNFLFWDSVLLDGGLESKRIIFH